MKKLLCLFLALALGLPAFAASFAEEPVGEIPGTIEYPYMGFRFVPPETFRNTRGIVEMEEPFSFSDIIRGAACSYFAMTEESYSRFKSGHGSNNISPEEIRMESLFTVFALGNGMTFHRFNTVSGLEFEEEYVRELARVGDTTFYLFMRGLNKDFMEDISPEYLDEYVAMAGDPDTAAAAISCFEPAERPDLNAGLIGSRLEFTTTDLDGNPVSSADLFAQNDITLVNFWAVWCGPCLGELEDLQAIHRNMQLKGVGVAGLLLDDYVEEAPAILEEYGVTYPVVLMPDLDGLITLEGYPTTVFVSSDGTVLAGPVAGADVGRYHTILNDLLRKK